MLIQMAQTHDFSWVPPASPSDTGVSVLHGNAPAQRGGPPVSLYLESNLKKWFINVRPPLLTVPSIVESFF